MPEFEFHVPDMSCGHCVATITEAVKALDADALVQAELGTKRVSIRSEADLQRQAWLKALDEAGYPSESADA